MKILIVLSFLLFSSSVFAVDSIGFFDGVFIFFADIWDFLTIAIPNAIGKLFIFLSTYALYIKFYLLKASLEFSHSVAVSFLGLVDIKSAINSAISGLSPDLRQAALDFRFFDGLTLVIEAAITRFVYQAST
mgnify:CR=1 FL=1